jgi:hypothetical protein
MDPATFPSFLFKMLGEGEEPTVDISNENVQSVQVSNLPERLPEEPLEEPQLDDVLPTFETGAVRLKGRALALGKRQTDSTDSPATAANDCQSTVIGNGDIPETKRRRFISSDADENDDKLNTTTDEPSLLKQSTEEVDQEPTTSEIQPSYLQTDSISKVKYSIHELALPNAIQSSTEEQISVFDKQDELDGILDMNAAFAQMKSKAVRDPLEGEFDSPEGITDVQITVSENAQQNNGQEPLAEVEEDVLYDSDGNAIYGQSDYSSEEEPEAEATLPQHDPNKVRITQSNLGFQLNNCSIETHQERDC